MSNMTHKSNLGKIEPKLSKVWSYATCYAILRQFTPQMIEKLKYLFLCLHVKYDSQTKFGQSRAKKDKVMVLPHVFATFTIEK